MGGKLYTLCYGNISSLESRPIEIKPFYHFYPGSTALTFATWSCNFRCPWCQNWTLSTTEPIPENANYIPVERMVETALNYGDEGLCASFQEPTLLFEYLCDLFTAGKKSLLYNCMVSNGYLTKEALHALATHGLDAIKIDLKGDNEVYKRYCQNVTGDWVLATATEARKLGLHVEIVNLVITGVNDDENCLEWVITNHLKNLGEFVPLHFTRYYPAYKFTAPATKPETIEHAYDKAKKAGVLYPYVGNLHGHKYEHTYCHSCGTKVIGRYGYCVVSYRLNHKNCCPNCGAQIPIRGRYVRKSTPIF